MIELRNVYFSYENVPVFKGLSLRVEAGEFLGVVGPNGSGKSTLLKLISGSLRPQRGEVFLDGREISFLPRKEVARKVAVVPQEYRLEFDFTVEEVVEMGRYVRGGSAGRVLEELNLIHLSDRFFLSLSGGEKQRVILAQALAQEPSVLLLDEPASHLDISYQLELFDLLSRLNREGLTIICVLHDLNLALSYCQRLILLSEGYIYAQGKAEEVLTPENIGHVYGVSAAVHNHFGKLFLTFFSPLETAGKALRIHLICGGGSGLTLINELYRRGFNLSLGAVNALDSDEVLGRKFSLPMAVEAPFSPISDETHQRNLELIDKAAIVILTKLPIGPGNLKNLMALKAAASRGKEVWIIDSDTSERDFTGKASEIISSLKGKVKFFNSEEEVLKELEKWES